ncbi:MAG: hypothetical protein IJR71_07675 [Prevotella sp.]|nr:hypothetical protein [Prevotella sp.]
MTISIAAKKLLCLFFILLPTVAQAYTDHRNTKTDSVEQVLASGRHLSDAELMDCYYELVRGYLGRDTEKHEAYCRKMLALSYEMNAMNMRESALYHLGLQHYGKEKYDEAEDYFMQALAVTDSMRGDRRYTEADIDDNYSQLYGALGNLYNMQDKLLLAIEYYQKALPIFERYGWLESLTILHHNVAELWLMMGNNDKAEDEYLKAIATGTQSGDSLMMNLTRKGLAKIYIAQNDYDKACQTLLPAYDYYHAHRDEEHGDYAEILASMTKLHLMQGYENLTQAKAYVREAIGSDNGELMFETRRDVYSAAAMVAMKEQNWQQALTYALQSIHENDDEATYSDVGCYEMLAVIYMHLGNKDEAQSYIRKVLTMMENFATEHYQSGLSQMEVIYETEKKQKAIEQLTREKKWVLRAGFLLTALLLLVAFIFFLSWRSVRLQRKTALFEARFEGEVAERRRIARDLHDGLGGMLSLLRLKTESMANEKGGATRDEVLSLIDATAKELRHVAHHLMPEQLLQYGLDTALNDLALSVPNASFRRFGLKTDIGRDREIVLYRCAYELVNNAIKHAGANHISIQLVGEPHKVTLTVGDDGCGFKGTEGNADSPTILTDTSSISTEGMGLQSISERVAHYRGGLFIVTGPGKGSEINVMLPV